MNICVQNVMLISLVITTSKSNKQTYIRIFNINKNTLIEKTLFQLLATFGDDQLSSGG